MIRDLTIKGLLLGITTGLLITVFDGLLILEPGIYVPYSYPFVLIIFNILFWAIIGSVSGFLLCVFTKEKDVKGKEDFYWLRFFLVPFCIIYGILGRIHIPHVTVQSRHTTFAFDHQFSFLWVSLILAFLAFYFRKPGDKKEFPSIFFAFEIVTFILLFNFCSNLLYVKKITGFYSKYQIFFQGISLERGQFLIVVYILGVLSIVGFYFIAFFKIRPILKKLSFIHNCTMVAILFFIVCGLLSVFFIYNQKNNRMEGLSINAASELQEEKKVSHVILIVLDTLRADRLSMYNNLATSKNLDMLAKGSLVFEQCIAPSSWTLPSHASLFTGVYVFGHMCIFQSSALPEKFITLAEIFRDHGYKTAAVVSNYGWLNPRFKIHQGFQIYNCLPNIGKQQRLPFRPILLAFSYLTNIYPKSILSYRTADDINRDAFYILKKSIDEPLFLFLNYNDAHTPYRPPKPFDSYFLEKIFPQIYRLTQYFDRLRGKHDKSSWDSYLLSQYDGEIAYLDYQLGKLFSRLKEMGIYDSSLIIVTSDHGELFGEHGLYEHHGPMYEGVIKIPLIIKFSFSMRVGREKGIINLTDVFPTILSICDLPIPDDISGKPFGNSSSFVVSELYGWEIGEHRVLYDGKYKYMRYEHERGPELYDLDNDPMEQENLVDKLPEVTLAMEEKLKTWGNTHKPKYKDSAKIEGTLSKEALEGLKALGYIQ